MPLENRCRRCGRLYVPDHADIVAGPDVAAEDLGTAA